MNFDSMFGGMSDMFNGMFCKVGADWTESALETLSATT